MRFKKGSIEAKEYMAKIRAQKKNNNKSNNADIKKLRQLSGKLLGQSNKKKGKGILSDVISNAKNYAINEGEKYIKDKGAELVNKGVDMAVKKIRGKGLLSDIGKNVFRTGLNIVPMPGVVKQIAQPVGEMLIDRVAGGSMNNKLVGNKTMVKNNMAKGGALRPMGGALLAM
jgi:hypothetical protein